MRTAISTVASSKSDREQLSLGFEQHANNFLPVLFGFHKFACTCKPCPQLFFKFRNGVIGILVVLGVANKLFEKGRLFKTVIVAMVVFWMFGFFIRRLINGERIMLKRA